MGSQVMLLLLRHLHLVLLKTLITPPTNHLLLIPLTVLLLRLLLFQLVSNQHLFLQAQHLLYTQLIHHLPPILHKRLRLVLTRLYLPLLKNHAQPRANLVLSGQIAANTGVAGGRRNANKSLDQVGLTVLTFTYFELILINI